MERLKIVVDRLVEATDPDRIVLFGSRARGDHGEDSDFDLCVIVPETRPFAERPTHWLWQLVNDVGITTDVLMRQTAVFDRRKGSVNSLERAVATEGRVLFERVRR